MGPPNSPLFGCRFSSQEITLSGALGNKADFFFLCATVPLSIFCGADLVLMADLSVLILLLKCSYYPTDFEVTAQI